MFEEKTNAISVVVGIMLRNEKDEYLFVKSNNFGGRWWLPGGHVEFREPLKEAVIRELEEETGIKISEANYLGIVEVEKAEDYFEPRHFVCVYYEGKVSGQVDIVIEKKELSKFKWMTLEQIKKEGNVSSLLKNILIDMENKEMCQKCEEYKTGWQRALADYKNLQKEISERRTEWVQMSEQQILEEFIPVYDHLKMSVTGVNDGGPWLEGVRHVLRQFAEILKGHGVEEIKTVGEKFDPIRHEAVGEESGENESGVIIKEVSSGYTMGGRTIKAAKVIVRK